MERNNLADLYYYDLLEHRVVLLDPDCSIKVQPSLCSSQRVIFDPEAREMRLLAVSFVYLSKFASFSHTLSLVVYSLS